MKSVKLLEMTSEELGGADPRPGGEVTYRGETYRVVEATPPGVKPPSKRRKPQAAPKWRLLVERVD